LSLGRIDLTKINIDYGNDVSAVYAVANIGELRTDERLLDLQNNRIHLDEFALNKSKIAMRLGKKEQARIVKQEAKKEVEAQKQAGWDVQISRFALNDNAVEFNDDHKPTQPHGMDYSHLNASHITLQSDNVVMNPDSVSMHVPKGAMKEKSGFELDQLT